MANTYFRIKKASTSGTPAEPPFDAWPVGVGTNIVDTPPTVNYPQAQKVNGRGYPVGIIGMPYTEFGRPRIGSTGYAYYNSLFEATTSGSAYVKVNLYDERSQAWAVYEGAMWRPTHGRGVIAGQSGPEWTDFLVRVTELQSSSW